MATTRISTPPAGVFRWLLRREFDGVFYRLLFKYNDRANLWFVDIADDSNIAKIFGVKMLLGTDKLLPFKYRDIPQGSLDVVDAKGAHTEPTLENFGEQTMLLYTDAVVV